MIKVNIGVLESNIRRLLEKQGHNTSSSEIISKVLMYAELRNNNQGIVKLITNGLLPNKTAKPIHCVFETPVSVKVDGGHQIGMVVVSECVSTAIKKARLSGIGIAACSGYASATGALGYWARDIARADLIGIVMSQCPEYVAPHGSCEPIFGTNPIAIGIPTKPRCQVLDMATSAYAYYGLILAREEGRSLPPDVAYDSQGQPTTDPVEALKGALRVFDRSYKGSHLALMVELLAGALTGAAMTDKANSHNWGSLILAIDPNIFGPDNLDAFQKGSAIMCDRVKSARPLPSSYSNILESEPVQYLPGERGDNLEAAHLAAGHLDLPLSTYTELMRQLEA